jgi:hypothetical protein
MPWTDRVNEPGDILKNHRGIEAIGVTVAVHVSVLRTRHRCDEPGVELEVEGGIDGPNGAVAI